MNAKQVSVWDHRYPFLFSVVLCALAVIGNLAGYIIALSYPTVPTFSEIGTMVFLCNLPVCFLMMVNVLRNCESKMAALEARIQQLESEKYHADLVTSA